MRIRQLTGGLAVAAALATTAAACGGSSSGGSDTVNAGSSGNSGTAAAVTTHSGPDGAYLTDASGRTLYIFAADKSSKSTCTGDCAKEWPPLTTTGTPTGTGSAHGGMLGTTDRADGTKQVTYAGHPLYRFDEDQAAGDMKGQGLDDFGGLWSAVTPDGTALSTSTPSSQPSSGGGGSSPEWG